MTGLRSVSVLTLPNHFHSLWCSTDFVLHGWLTGALLQQESTVKFIKSRGDSMKYTCPCCGYKTLDEEPPNTYYICEICFSEHDGYQYKYPDETGANYVSFREAQQNFIKFGAKGERSLKFVRPPNKSDIKDPNWKPL